MADQLNLNASSGFKSPPKYSFTHSPVLGKDKPSKQPGPGEYPQMKSEKDKFGKTPSWSIGGATRGGKDWAPMPGPGAYTPSNPDFVSPKWGFTNDNRLKPNKRSTTPGPGQYELKSTLQGRDVSICSKPESKGLTGTLPGPGAFTPSWSTTSNYGSAPSIGFGASNKPACLPDSTKWMCWMGEDGGVEDTWPWAVRDSHHPYRQCDDEESERVLHQRTLAWKRQGRYHSWSSTSWYHLQVKGPASPRFRRSLGCAPRLGGLRQRRLARAGS